MVGHQFQFKIWRKSPDTQHLIETFFILIIGIAMVFYANRIVDLESETLAQNALIENISAGIIPGNLVAEHATLDKYSSEYYTDIMILLSINTICIGYFIKDIQELLYCNIRNIVVQQFTLRFMINMMGSLIVVYWHARHWIIFEESLNTQSGNQKYAIIQTMQNDIYFNIFYTVSVLTAFQFFRLILAFKLNRLFGPMAKTMASMFLDVVQFLGLFFSIFIVFMATGTLLFSDLIEFKGFIDAFNTLFAASFASYDHTIYERSKNVDPIVGYVFITLYIIISSVLLLNFLIAILSSTYSFIQEQRNGLYIQEVIYHMQRSGYHQKFGSLVSVTVPFSIFFLPLTPVILSAKSKTLNNIIQHIQYSPIAFIIVITFFTISLILIPFAYLIQLFNKFRKSLFYSKGD